MTKEARWAPEVAADPAWVRSIAWDRLGTLESAGVDLVRADVTAPGRVVGTAGGWARVTKEARWAREVVADPAWVRSIA